MALTSDRIRSVQNHGEGVRLPVAASTRIYKGGIYGVNSAGDVVSGANGAEKLGGIAETSADNSSGAAGDKSVTLLVRDHTEWLPRGALTAAAIGAAAFSDDDDDIDTTGALPVGTFGPIDGDFIAVFVGSFPYQAPSGG